MNDKNKIKSENQFTLNAKIAASGLGLGLLFMSQLLLSFGYEFLMSQRPIDFAHWSMLFAALLLFSLWFSLPKNYTKLIGLLIMTIGIGGIIGMCCIDFILWAANDNPELKEQIFNVISSETSINIPFLILGPTCFYMGIGISTYALFSRYKWQVIILNIGLMMIGLGHLVFQNRTIPVIGSLFLLVGLLHILIKENKRTTEL